MATISEAIARSRVQWRDMGPRAWFLASAPSSSDLQQVVVPASALTLLRRGKDVVLLPTNNDATHDFIDFCKELLHLSDDQVLFTEDSGNFMVESNHGNIVARLDELLQRPNKPDGETYMLVPRKVTAAVKKWLPRLQEKGLLVFGEGTPSLKHSSAAIIYRQASDMDTPSLLEDISVGVKVPHGYVCSRVNGLLDAYARLESDVGPDTWTGVVEIMPIKALGGAGRIRVGSEQELAMYDFPLGDVVLKETVAGDSTAEGLPCIVYVAFLQGRLLPPMEVMRNAGNNFVAIRSCRLEQELQAKIMNWCSQLLEKTSLNAQGVGAFELVIRNNEAVLNNVTSGFENEHFPLLFAQAYAPTSRVYAWNFTPAQTLDVWTFWYRLYDSGVTFRPGKKRSTAGVFPIVYQKEKKSMFIAIAETDEEVERLYKVADKHLREPVVDETLERVGLDDNVRRIWCGSARPEYRRETQRYNLPNRCISLVRKDLDYIILPGNHTLTREYWEFNREVRNLNEDQVIFTSNEHFVMDDDVDDEIISRIKAIVTRNPKDKFCLIPYCVTANFERWSTQLKEIGVTVFGEEFEWVEKYGHKGILHRYMSSLDKPSILEEIAPNVRVAKGYTCQTREELVKAWEMLACETVVVKPVFGAAGEGILFISDVEQLKTYDFAMGDVSLEEFLTLDRTADGIVLSPAVHYLGETTFGKGLVDQIMVGTSYAGWRRSQASKVFQQTCSRAVNKIIKALQPKGPGGFDFLSVEGIPFLTDVNTGRFNGAHYPKLFQEMYCADKVFYCFKFKPPASLTVKQFWYRLQSADIAFTPGESESGVFPLVYLRGLSGLYVAIAKTDREAYQLYESAKSCLTERQPIPKRDVAQCNLPSIVRMTLIKNPDFIYSPDPLNFSGVLVAGKQVVALLNETDMKKYEEVVSACGGTIIDAKGMLLVPGFIDPHVHITGGGGEMGPSSRTPEMTLSSLVDAGITTVVGVTGTDSISRSMENLLTKARALAQEGITAYFWSGAYRVPTPTVTGSISRDICLIEQCIGVGEIAIGDHRGSQPTVHDLEVLGSECRVGGMLANKAGVVHLHMGKNPGGLPLLRAAVMSSALPITAFYPTHMSRNRELVDEGARWIKEGGYVDFTARSRDTISALTRYFASGVNLDHVTVSSDAGGSFPTFDEHGNLLRYGTMDPKCLLGLVKKLHFDLQWPMQRILPLLTRNTAEVLKFESKGTIAVGKDADLLLLDSESLDLKYVFALGQLMKGPNFIQKGMFEP
eukprot:m.250105 g.250105  ORF g.250105 m.250105 type:complete len:1262 (-) comp17172_c3_seq3:208-3993(-)